LCHWNFSLWSWGRLSLQLITLPPSCAVVMKSGNRNFLEPSGSLQVCNGTASLFLVLLTRCYFQIFHFHTCKCNIGFPDGIIGFFIDVILPAALCACGRLSFEQKWVSAIILGGEDGLCAGLISLIPSCAGCLEIWELQLPRNSQDLSMPVDVWKSGSFSFLETLRTCPCLWMSGNLGASVS